MKSVRWFVFALIGLFLLTGCGGAKPSLTPTSGAQQDAIIPSHEATEGASSTPRPTPIAPSGASRSLAAFAPSSGVFARDVMRTEWTPQAYSGADVSLPVDLSLINNPEVLAGLTAEQRAFLSQNGFAIIHNQEGQFDNLRKAMVAQGQPYYLTTDAAFHSLHLNFDDTLKELERQALHPTMREIVRSTLNEVLNYLPQVEGTSLEADTYLAAAYLSVALKLFDPTVEIDARIAADVDAQIAQIMAESGQLDSVLIEGFTDDYGAYRPVGHYAGDPDLEQYFRGMTWLGRVHFPLQDGEQKASRAPLIITMALRSAQMTGDSASSRWTDVDEVLAFMIGPTDDLTPSHYAVLMDSIYGTQANITPLADDTLWAQFQSRGGELAGPRIHSTFLPPEVDISKDVGWRFMGQRFTLDGQIFQQLMYDWVDENPDGSRRDFPTGPDVMAILGSPVALDAVGQAGEADYPNYVEQIMMLQGIADARTEEQWQAIFYDAWLYAFTAVMRPKDQAFPTYMQTPAWAYKEMNTALGSWAELKHDTILYTKMPDGRGGGGPPTSPEQAAYIEPNPAAFYQMAYMGEMLAAGLDERGFGMSGAMREQATQFQQLSDLAAKTLRGEELSEQERSVILHRCLSMAECQNVYGDQPLEPMPIVAAVAGNGGAILEAATGYVDRMYVVMRDGDAITVAQGGVFSYYEFIQPRNDRLTDEAWRERLDSDAPPLPVWAANFMLPGGQTTYALAFRVGDVYRVSEEGDGVNLRAEPSTSGAVLRTLPEDTYFTIMEGPVDADGHRWWKVELFIWGDEDGPSEGWLMENQDWYWRSY